VARMTSVEPNAKLPVFEEEERKEKEEKEKEKLKM
jgi:hypothetical protein